MITKLVLTDSYDFGQPSTQLVPQLNSGRVDDTWLRKQAGLQCMFDKEISQLQKRAGHSVFHIIALGDEEAVGANRNGDAFSEKDTKTAHVHFKERGHVFVDHKNNDPRKAVGEVLATGHNDDMGRVELLVDVDNKKLPDRYQQKIANGEDLAWSMGCFTAGHMVKLDDSICKPIEDVQLGEEVITHEGHAKPVVHLFKKQYDGPLVTVQAKTLDDITCTIEHPFLVLPKHAIKRNGGVRRFDAKDVDLSLARWVPAKELKPGDYLLTPVTYKQETADFLLSRDLVRLLGYYLAEGHIRMTPAGNYCSVTFSINENDHARTDIPEICERLGFKPPVYSQHRSSNFGAYLTISDAGFAYLCDKHCGRMSKLKMLSRDLMDASIDVQKELLAAYINGDGCQMNAEWQRGSAFVSTASPRLRDQIVEILTRLGATTGYNKVVHKAGGGFNFHETLEYQIYIAKADIHLLAGTCEKIAPVELSGHKRGGARMHLGKYVATPIADVTITAQSPGKSVTVYNLEVADDNSYVVNGVAVHNSQQKFDTCSYCKFNAPTAADHCVHIKTALMEILDDGQQIYMQNPNPSFFDISGVGRPADRIGYSLRKVAYSTGTVGGHELAADLGLNPIALVKGAMLTRLAAMEKHTPVRGRQLDLKPETVRQLKQACDCMGNSPVLRMLADKGAVLSPRDFADIFVGHPDPEGAGEAIESCEGGVSSLTDPIEIGSLDPGDKRPIDLSDDADRDLHESCGCDNEPFQRRIIRITIVKPKLATIVDTAEASGLAQLYQHYKLAFAVHNFDRADVLRNVAYLP
jgi:intein/homing endonuclease